MIGDEELIRRILQKDETALKMLIQKYQSYVFAIIHRFVKDPQEIENIAQEVFFKVYRSLPTYHFDNFKGWIGKIATTRSIDFKRKMKNKPCNTWDIDEENIIQLEPQRVQTPEELYIKKENQYHVRKICEHLPHIYKNTLIQFYFEGKTYEQIASTEGISKKTVESRLYRGRHLFEKKWSEENETL